MRKANEFYELARELAIRLKGQKGGYFIFELIRFMAENEFPEFVMNTLYKDDFIKIMFISDSSANEFGIIIAENYETNGCILYNADYEDIYRTLKTIKASGMEGLMHYLREQGIVIV